MLEHHGDHILSFDVLCKLKRWSFRALTVVVDEHFTSWCVLKESFKESSVSENKQLDFKGGSVRLA